MRIRALIVLNVTGAANMADGARSFGWYRLDQPWIGCVPPESIAWSSLTHIALDGPTVLSDCTAICNRTATAILLRGKATHVLHICTLVFLQVPRSFHSRARLKSYPGTHMHLYAEITAKI